MDRVLCNGCNALGRTGECRLHGTAPCPPRWRQEFRDDFAVPPEVEALVILGEAQDLSWHNDVCPSFGIQDEDKGEVIVRLWVHHPVRSEREFDVVRFCVTTEADETTDWSGDDVHEAVTHYRAHALKLLGFDCSDCDERCEADEATPSWDGRPICQDCKKEEQYAEVSGKLPTRVFQVRLVFADGSVHDGTLYRSEASAQAFIEQERLHDGHRITHTEIIPRTVQP